MKYYFEDIDSECCYTLDYFQEQLGEGLTEMQIYPAIIMYGESFFWCRKLHECGEVGEICGKECEHYSPRNGKNGRCRFSANCYTHADKPITIKLTDFEDDK